ncbi:hypothetical protein GQ53DRAFT_411765 [Thozetella sp. PMI_491]|nr:hypothetical protein GQ53DRAFT_411765 [Thozetella sp. PMI_491]
MDSPGSPTAEPPRKRRPLSKACEACKIRKAKCDSVFPCCGLCRKKGTECVYREKEQPGLRRGYGKSLEQRLHHMDESLQQIHQILREHSSYHTQQPLPSQPGVGLPLDNANVSRGPQPEGISPQDTIAPLQFHNVPFESSGNGHVYLADPPQHVSDGLPPHHMLLHLVDLYFEFAHPWMNILRREQFQEAIFAPEQTPILHGIVLIGLQYWTDAEPSPALRQHYMDTARDKILTSAVEKISVTSARALIFLAFDALGHGPTGRMLNIMALLNTAVSQLDLTPEAADGMEYSQRNLTRLVRNQVNEAEQSHDQLSQAETEDRCRLFWTIYTLERIVSVSHGIECRIGSNLFRRIIQPGDEVLTARRRLEMLSADVQVRAERAALSGSWPLLIEIVTLIERVNDFLLRPVDFGDGSQLREWKSHFHALDASLGAWKEKLPSGTTGEGSEFDPVLTIAAVIHYTAVIRMQSVAAFPPRTFPQFTASPLAPGRCHQAVLGIASVCEAIKPHEFSKLGPLFVFPVWVAARNRVVLWTVGWEEQTPGIPAELATLRNVLREMSQNWVCAQNYVSMIDFVVESHHKASEMSALAVFSDISKTAYGLHSVLGPRIKQNAEVQMAQMTQMKQFWEWADIPGLEHESLFVGGGASALPEI